MGSVGGTKAMGHNNGGYDGDRTSKIVLRLWQNNNNRIRTMAKHWEPRQSCSEHGNNNQG